MKQSCKSPSYFIIEPSCMCFYKWCIIFIYKYHNFFSIIIFHSFHQEWNCIIYSLKIFKYKIIFIPLILYLCSYRRNNCFFISFGIRKRDKDCWILIDFSCIWCFHDFCTFKDFFRVFGNIKEFSHHWHINGFSKSSRTSNQCYICYSI